MKIILISSILFFGAVSFFRLLGSIPGCTLYSSLLSSLWGAAAIPCPSAMVLLLGSIRNFQEAQFHFTKPSFYCKFAKHQQHPLFSAEFYIIIFVVLGILLGGLVFIFSNNKLQESRLPKITTPKIDHAFKSKISQPKLVHAIVDWCIHHIGDKQNQPNVQISYYPHRKKYGCYLIDKKLIRIYIKNHKSIETLALTIIHEFVHYIEIKTDKESKNYARLHQDFGYETNPYERSANLIATQYYQQCLMDLSAKGYLYCELPLA